MPDRIQLRRTKGWRKPQGAVVAARPSRWGNPYTFADKAPAHRSAAQAIAVQRYRWWLEGCRLERVLNGAPPSPAAIRAALAGRDLCCWCAPGAPCHADVLLDIANRAAPDD
jgi:hypothetical protein